MNRSIFLSIFCFSINIAICHGQGGINSLPPQFFRIFESYPLTNPSYAVVDSNLSLTLGNKMNFGSFKIFRTHYLSLTCKPRFSKNSDASRKHGIGFIALTDKDGEYIQYNRFYITYAYKIYLSENIKIAAGATIGLANNSIQGTNVSPSGSALAPDASIGVWIYGNKNYIGASLGQLTRSSLQPIGETFYLVRNINATAGRRFQISHNSRWTSAVNLRTANGFKTDIDFMNVLLIQNIFSAGFNYRHHKNLVLTLGLENLRFHQSRHMGGAWFSYAIPFRKYTSPNIQTYEITISYKIL